MKDEAPDPSVDASSGELKGNITPEYDDILEWLEIEGDVEDGMAGEFLTDAWMMEYGEKDLNHMKLAMGHLGVAVQQFIDSGADKEDVQKLRKSLVDICWQLANELEQV